MKPRFSILTLLGITGYVAIEAAAFAQQDSYWPGVAFYLNTLVLTAFALVACGRACRVSIFARGFLTGYWLYSWVRYDEFSIYNNDEPNLLLFVWWRRIDPDISVVRDVILLRASCILFGLLLGSFALWFYQCQERRERKRPQSND